MPDAPIKPDTGCPGVREPIRGRVEALCGFRCAIWGRPGVQLTPAAVKDSQGVMRCPNQVPFDEAGG